MNWMQKVSSVTFSLEGSHKISQPKTILDLIFELQKYSFYDKGVQLPMRTVEPDGDDFDQMLGTINWYVTSEIPEEQQIEIMQSWIQEKQLMEFQMQLVGPEVSGMSQPGESPLMVYRIHVTQNGSSDYMEIPEMNLANTNASAVMEALGIPFDWSGSIDLNEFKTKLEMFTPWDQQGLTQAPEESGGDDRIRSIDMGRSEDQVSRYIERFNRLVDFGLQNGFTTLQWG